jgi:pilus assembly protein Flp/PilA
MVAMKLWAQYAISRLMDREDGAAAVEYGLLVALIAVAIIVTVSTLGGQLDGFFQTVTDCLGSPANCGGAPTT